MKITPFQIGCINFLMNNLQMIISPSNHKAFFATFLFTLLLAQGSAHADTTYTCTGYVLQQEKKQEVLPISVRTLNSGFRFSGNTSLFMGYDSIFFMEKCTESEDDIYFCKNSSGNEFITATFNKISNFIIFNYLNPKCIECNWKAFYKCTYSKAIAP